MLYKQIWFTSLTNVSSGTSLQFVLVESLHDILDSPELLLDLRTLVASDVELVGDRKAHLSTSMVHVDRFVECIIFKENPTIFSKVLQML